MNLFHVNGESAFGDEGLVADVASSFGQFSRRFLLLLLFGHESRMASFDVRPQILVAVIGFLAQGTLFLDDLLLRFFKFLFRFVDGFQEAIVATRQGR